MPFKRPTLKELDAGIAADIEGRLEGADARLRRAVLTVLARVFAGALHGLYGFLDWTSRQVFPDTAEKLHLDRWAALWGVARKPAWPAAGDVSFTGTNGTIIPAGTELQRSDGQLYTTDIAAVVAGGTATVAVTASEAGVGGNAVAASKLSFVSPVAGIESSVTIGAGGLALGSDEEKDDALLLRLLLRIQQPPHGGAKHDYYAWALDSKAHGKAVTRAWVYPEEYGIGTVAVRFMMDDDYVDGIPFAADVTAVQAYIDTVRPVTAAVSVLAPVPQPLNFEIAGLDPLTPQVQATVEAELKDLIRRESEPGGTLLISHIREAISIATGERDHQLLSPAADVVRATGKVTTFGAVVWS